MDLRCLVCVCVQMDVKQRILESASKNRQTIKTIMWSYGLWWYNNKETLVKDVIFMMLSECRHIMNDVASPKSAIIRSVPACLRHPIASKKSVSEFYDAMGIRVIPNLNGIVRRKKKDRWSMRLENPPTSPFMHDMWEILGEMIREEALNDMYIIARIHELGIMPQSEVWYNDCLNKIRGLDNWEMVCESSEHVLYQHPMLPHPDHMIFVRRVELSEKSSWASVVASPRLIFEAGDEDILIMSRLTSCPDMGRPDPVEECVVRVESVVVGEGIVFDDLLDRAMDMADE